MKSIWNKLHKIGDILHLPDMPNWLVGILALVLILRIPSFFEPYYYGDEMIYLSLGQGVRQGLTLYQDVFDNKPPLLYLTAAIAGNLFWFKAILALWILVTVFVFYKLSKLLFDPPSPKASEGQGKIATLIFAILTTIPLLEGNTINAELFMIGPVILAFLILLTKNLNTKLILLAGILFGISALFKIPAIFDFPVIILYWLITSNFKTEWKDIIKKTFFLSLGLITPFLITFVWYFFRGALGDYITAAYLQNLNYIHSWTVRDVPMIYRFGIVICGIIILWFFRNKLSKKFIFFTLWLLYALFGVVLSGRPYPHYLIQATAPISFLLAMFFVDKTLEQSLTVIPLTLAIFVPFYYQFYVYPTASYYQRFINLAIHKISKEEYINSFGSKVNRNYKIAEFLTTSSTPKDNIFMWDPDSAAVYALSRRLPPIKYVADYHINDYSSKMEVANQLENNPPKFIILTSDHPYSEINTLLKNKYLLVEQIDDADIYVRKNEKLNF
ncbi:MAG TPA: hypothetical protein VL401_04260 [Alphaproteobacteria bacterium]|jgi:hypothetical protein|nr:hypothetical protein [Alphaproteobacteria bacterium]